MVLPLAGIAGVGSALIEGIDAFNKYQAGKSSARGQAAAQKRGAKVARRGLKAQKKAQKKGKQTIKAQQRMLGDLINLLQAPRSDVFGNKTHYVPGRGWVTDLTGRTKEILSGEELDTLRRQGQAAQGAEDYQQTRNKLLYGGKSQEGTTAEIARLLSYGARDASDKAKARFGQQALRANMGNLIPQIIRQAGETGGEDLADILLKARTGGSKLYQDEEGFRTRELLNQLKDFWNVSQSSPKSGLAERLSNQQSDALTALTGGVQTAAGEYGDIAKTLSGMYPDYSSLMSAVSGAAPTSQPMDLSFLGDLLKSGANLIQPTNTTTVAKTQAQLKPTGGSIY